MRNGESRRIATTTGNHTGPRPEMWRKVTPPSGHKCWILTRISRRVSTEPPAGKPAHPDGLPVDFTRRRRGEHRTLEGTYIPPGKAATRRTLGATALARRLKCGHRQLRCPVGLPNCRAPVVLYSRLELRRDSDARNHFVREPAEVAEAESTRTGTPARAPPMSDRKEPLALDSWISAFHARS